MVMLSLEAVLLTFSWNKISEVSLAAHKVCRSSLFSKGGWQVCLPRQILNEPLIKKMQLCSVIEVYWHLSSASKILHIFPNQKFLD